MTDYAQAATKQNRIIPGCASSEFDEVATEMARPKASNLKKDNAQQREVKDSAAQPQSYVIKNLITSRKIAKKKLTSLLFFLLFR